MGNSLAQPLGIPHNANTITTYSDSPRLIVTTAEQANKLLEQAEKADQYRTNIFNRPIERQARRNHNYFPMSNTQYNRENLQRECDKFMTRLWQSKTHEIIYKELNRRKITVYIVNLQHSADAGMPHTRPLHGSLDGLICMPGGLKELFDERQEKTLIHELVHIIQRSMPQYWNRVYRDFWNMVPFEGKLPEKYELARRINPDTLPKELYLYKNTWVPFCMFRDITTPDIRDTLVCYYNIHTGVVWTDLPTDLYNDEIFSDPKILAPMREHPNEMAAWVLADVKQFEGSWIARP